MFTFTRKPGYGSIARGTTIDAYLSAEDTAALYETWKSEWPEPYGFRGGEKAVTCEMVAEVGLEALTAALAEKRSQTEARKAAGRIMDVARSNQGR
jgi:hypothetical protein